MKTKLLILLSLAILTGTKAFTQSSDVAYLRIVESIALTKYDSYMMLTGSDGSIDRVELNKIESNGDGTDNNGVLISKKIKEVLDSGYSIESHSTGGGYELSYTTIVFVKEE